MEQIKLRLLKPFKYYKPGDVIRVMSNIMAHRLIDDGTAERYIPKKEKNNG